MVTSDPECSVARQVYQVVFFQMVEFQVNAEGAIGVVVMSNSCEGSSDYLSVLSDADSVNYNV